VQPGPHVDSQVPVVEEYIPKALKRRG